MNKKGLLSRLIATMSVATMSVASFANTNSDWYLHSAISPDSKHIAFSYKGDIYLVSSDGGTARPLTVHSDWDGHPVWSSDGKSIAFASDRNGDLDVYVMPAQGGVAKRLTFHSSNDIPTDFSADDNSVVFVSARTDSAQSSVYPTSRLTESYKVSISGGTPAMISTIPGSELQVSADGNTILYRDEKAYENQFRKHDVSAFARDIWMMDTRSGEHTQLTDFEGGDHNPVWADKDTIYYTSEEDSGAFNVWRMDLDGDNKKQITNFEQHPVRSLSISDNDTLAFAHHGSIYVQKGSSAKRLEIDVKADVQENQTVPQSLSGKITEFAVSPDGKEVAFVARGEVFVASTKFNTTKRITNTPQQERGVSFHKDGKTLLYASERSGIWGLYEASILNDEPYFFAATTIAEKAIHLAESDSFQALYSPDGEKIAFLSGRDEIQVLNRETKVVNVALGKQHNYSYADGDISFAWAPDSHWMTADYATRGRLFITNVGVFPADGSQEPVDISQSGYYDGAPHFHKDGNAVLWASTRYGQRDHGSWGREADVMAAFLTRESFDKFRLSKEEFALQKELDDKAKEEETEDSDEAEETEEAEVKEAALEETALEETALEETALKESDSEDESKALDIEWNNLDQRTVRLTLHASDLSDFVLTSDTETLYYLARFEKGYDLWQHKIREKSTKLAAKLNARNASLTLSDDGKTLYVLADGKLKSGAVGDKVKLKSIGVKPDMLLNVAKEREFMFNHSWRVIKDKFYREDFHGIDWDAMGEAYRTKLPSIGHNRDLANMFAEMTGELNASHIGSSYRPGKTAKDDNTGTPGLFFDLTDTGGGLKVDEVVERGPFDKAGSKVEPGVVLNAVNGVQLDGSVNLYELLNHTAGKRVRFSFTDAQGESFDEVIKPITYRSLGGLLYRRWVDNREKLVEELSGGRLAYVHVRSMNDPSFRDVYSRLLGKHFDKEAVIVDTRWNGGGWLHNDLAKLLTGDEYFTMHVRGRQYAGDPLDQWNKPSVMLINEGNYSDAHAFAYTYDHLEIGEMVGMPVPGTMTAVWWETGISGDFRAGVPQVGMKNTKGEYLENNQTNPDHMVKNDPQSQANGQDKQVEKAVEVLLNKLDNQ